MSNYVIGGLGFLNIVFWGPLILAIGEPVVGWLTIASGLFAVGVIAYAELH